MYSNLSRLLKKKKKFADFGRLYYHKRFVIGESFKARNENPFSSSKEWSGRTTAAEGKMTDISARLSDLNF